MLRDYRKHGVNVTANGQFLAALITFMQEVGPAIQAALPAIEAIIALFGSTPTPTPTPVPAS